MANNETPTLLTIISTKLVDNCIITTNANGDFQANNIRFDTMSNGDVACYFESVDYDGAESLFETDSLFGNERPLWVVNLVGHSVDKGIHAHLYQEIVEQMRALYSE